MLLGVCAGTGVDAGAGKQEGYQQHAETEAGTAREHGLAAARLVEGERGEE